MANGDPPTLADIERDKTRRKAIPQGNGSTLELGAPSVAPSPMSGGFNVDPRVVNAVIDRESGGRPDARGRAGEIGLMQIMPKTAASLGVDPSTLSDPSVNVAAGTKLLSKLMTKYHGDLTKTLAAYNAGEGAVDRGAIPASTQKYVSDVLARIGSGASAQMALSRRPSAQQGAMPLNLAQNFGAAWGPSTAYAGEAPSQGQPAGPPAPSLAQQLGAPSLRDRLNQGVSIATSPYRAAEDVARPMYRAAFAGTPFRPGDIPPSIMQRLPPSVQYALTRDPRIPGYQARTQFSQLTDPLQRGQMQAADIGAAVAPGLLFSKVGPGQMLGLPGLSGGRVSTQRDLEDLARGVYVGGRRAYGEMQQPQAQQPSPAAAPSPTAFQQFKAAWQPGTAEAAEGPPTVADIERDKARRKTAIPQGKDESQAPWPVKAAGWAPSIGQAIGEYGLGAATEVGTAGASTPAEMAIMGAGGGTGYGAGEMLVNQPVRWAYGYPNKPLGQVGKESAEAGAVSAAMVPGSKLLKGVLPASLKAGIAGKRAVQAEVAANAGTVERLLTQLAEKLKTPRQVGEAVENVAQRITKMPEMVDGMLQSVGRFGRNPAEMTEHVRNAVGTYILRAGEGAKDGLEQLARMRQSIARLSEDAVGKLFNTSRRELTEIIDTTVKENARWLRRPDLSAAVRDEIEHAPYRMRKYIQHHMSWVTHWSLIKLLWNPVEAVKDFVGIKIGGGLAVAGSKAINSPIMRRLYVRLLTSQTAPEVRLITRALINAAATHGIMSLQNQQPTAPEEPAAEPEAPAAEPTPSAPSAPEGLGAAPAPSGDESTQEIEPEGPTQQLSTWTE